MDLEAAADTLYGLPREEFTSARGELVKQARATGDRELATAIGGLRRPTVAAWLLNQLARQRPEELRTLTELGERLRAAHEQLDGAALRELSGQRRDLLSGLTRSAREVGRAAGVRMADAAARELEEMFGAALADAPAARALAGGRISSAKTLTETDGGWPSVAPRARPRPAPVRAPAPTGSGPRESGPKSAPESKSEPDAGTEPAREAPNPALGKARTELARLSAALAEAERRHTEAGAAYDHATAEETEAQQRVARRRAELVAAEQREQQARQRARFARRARDDADRARAQAHRRVTMAADRLAALRD